ncbi:MAG: complex I subunit 5 family protein [Dethiobacteria bacterium]
MSQNEIAVSIIPVLIVLLPLFGVAGTMLADRYRPGWRKITVIVSVSLPLLLAVIIYPRTAAGVVVYQMINLLPPAGLEFRVDILSIYMLLLFSFFSLIIVIYSLGYYRDREEGRKFFYFLLIAISGCLGVALSGNMFTFFLFFEMMSLSFFPLAAYKSTPEGYSAGLKFFFMTIISGVALFWAVVITNSTTGSLAFGTGGLVTEAKPILLVAFICYLIAFGIKAAMIPLHIWMPDAYAAAPTPAATLSSAMMLKTGVLGLIRVFHDIFGLSFLQETGWNNILLVLAIISMLYGSICAFAQDDLNRRLAYSGVAQVGYMLLGLALLTEMALVGTIYHIMAHAFMKGCMFLCAGVIFVNTGKTKISEMKGIGMQMPVTMLAFTIAAVSAVGIPPFNIFVSKWHLGLGAIQAGMPAIIIVLLLSSVLNASYYFPISINAFLGCRELKNIERQRLRLQPMRMVPVIILAAGAFIFTLAPYNWPLSLARAVAQLYF